ncbi:MAG: CPBP family intramembrane metalloprotease [Microbacterium sp.]|uniref:CPBP family intramembrane glutamic endopeptidase n=1 Tax=Microbacterium sp. TaxID=51671 RepID=UPI001987A29A|nr:CPBP family intramembrane glutamic endopeptidase [Microbacterium sp.]MBD3756681.1 CPBP family intramembrane metalloprotease [Microbacterium sp.]
MAWPGVLPGFAALPAWAATALDAVVVLAPLVAGALVAARAAGPAVARALGIRVTLIDLVLGVLVALVARAVVEIVTPTRGSLLSPFGDTDADQLAVSIVAVVLFAPIVEELFFRGAVQRALQALLTRPARPLLPSRAAAAVAIGVTTIAFVGLHAVPDGGAVPLGAVLAPLLVGVGAGVLTAATGRIAAGVVAHVLFNAAGIALLLV